MSKHKSSNNTVKSKPKNKQKVQDVSLDTNNSTKSITVTFKDDAFWSEVVEEFLLSLSKAYGYTIDEYDLLGIVWAFRKNRIGRLLNKQPESEIFQREFVAMASMAMHWKEKGNQMRADYAMALEALKPRETNK